MKRTFVFQEGDSQKFWSIEINGASITVVFGRLGVAGKDLTKSYATEADCQKEANKLIAEKTKKGYKEIPEGVDLPGREKVADGMSVWRFWKIIELARKESDGWEDMFEPLVDRLAKLDIKDIILWNHIFCKYLDLSCKSKLWAAAYIINGGCSDDGFDYFRGWLIAQGKNTYYNALKEPDSLSRIVEDEVEFEEILSAGMDAYCQKTGNDDYDEFTKISEENPLCEKIKQEVHSKIEYAKDIDAEWPEEDDALKKLLPKLFKKFNGE